MSPRKRKPLRACKRCHYLTTEERCPRCGGETTDSWEGYVAILKVEQSDVAKVLGIEEEGEYALQIL